MILTSTHLPWPEAASAGELAALRRLARKLSSATTTDPVGDGVLFACAKSSSLYDLPVYEAAGRVLMDLVERGWSLSTDVDGIEALPQIRSKDPLVEKERVRAQEHVARDAQLREPSVQRFIQRMQTPRHWNGELTSVYSLMTDGQGLRDDLVAFAEGRISAAEALDPYVQVVESGAVCELTGLLLTDVWRYFRHTWASSYSTVPGRTMQILIRDGSRPFHPVIGLAALSSPVVQIGVRDQWVGWDVSSVLEAMDESPTVRWAKWLKDSLAAWVDQVWAGDFERAGITSKQLLDEPDEHVVTALRAHAQRAKRRHQGDRSPGLRQAERDDWRAKAETDLFVARRADLLADLLEAKWSLRRFLWPRASVGGMRQALGDAAARRSIGWIVRRAKADRVGSIVADLSVCGALPPYSALAAGKLVAMLATSPSVIRWYAKRYARPSEIASSIAGRPIVKDARLSLISTSSLYGSGSSQYNRLYWPATLVGGEDQRLGFVPLGKSVSYGTSQFSPATVAALRRLVAVTEGGITVNGIFGEGVSPRMRKVRSGLDVLGWPGDALLKHGRQRIVYGFSLIGNLLDFSLGTDADPDYLFDVNAPDDVPSLSSWWLARWGSPRVAHSHVQDEMCRHTLQHPRSHGAIVSMYAGDSKHEEIELF